MAEIKAEQVPDAVSRALGQELGFIQHRNAYCKAIAAALNAWPGMATEFRRDSYMGWDGNLIILPLPQEASDDQ